MSAAHVHDVAGVGIGPFNLGLACLTEPLEELDCVFLEREAQFAWHPGMLLETSTLQVPFLADLVSLADPTSPFSFLNWLKETGTLYGFYIRERFQPLRTEYDDYCRWAAGRLRSLRFGREVVAVEHDAREDAHVVRAVDRATGADEVLRARTLVLGVGTVPHVPPGCDGLDEEVAVHTAGYLPARDRLAAQRSVVLVGGGQSAAEVFLDLLGRMDDEQELVWLTRSPRFFPLEYTKLTLELTSPEYARYVHALPEAVRDGVVAQQAPLYKGIDAALIDEVFDELHRRRVQGRRVPLLLTGTALEAARRDAYGRVALDLLHGETGERIGLEADALVLATGYRYDVPAFLEPIRDRIAWDGRGRYAVREDYTVQAEGPRVFVQNAELHTHGFVAPDLGMGAHRNSTIIRALLGREVYPVEERIAMQRFGAPQRPLAEAIG
ncbi:lysine N(6)-hydroxylase/L-ornithine N(5)-oxygenase family protein [Conexibacter sp. SYSU D00693]|uniref:lysine N(6)-hydroxylase/L-ornithine N(5)-oxygenase family protein n=1 Tax=Conexibacter sp. SYSU D00693 TaxID=2812560 RepID=UPI00196B7893|nr:SidA/IucD/PvdA family monooxygenase [Conexibacter sp. SYSU D00693]